MSDDRPKDHGDPMRRHWTTRRGFVSAAGFAVVSLYGVWAAHGAAPTGVGLLAGDGSDEVATGAAGHHGSGPGGPSPDEFRRRTYAFIDANALSDGSVEPGLHKANKASSAAEAEHHEDGAADDHGVANGHESDGHGEAEEVYVMCTRYAYVPSVLRLQRGRPYRFRMMALDTSHGAAIQLGRASHVIRLRRGALVEQDIVFAEPGEYLCYCTVYCGPGHQMMSAKIVVT